MTIATARTMLNMVSTLEGMLAELDSKQQLLWNQLRNTCRPKEIEKLSQQSKMLEVEYDNLGVSLDMVESLTGNLATAAAA